MASVTLSIPDELKEEMNKFPEVKWSEVLREITMRRVKQLKKFVQMVEKGEI